MPEEKKEEPKEQQQAQTDDQAKEVQGKLDAANNRIAEYERLLLDPSYLEFVAGRGQDGHQQVQRKVVQRAAEEQVDLDSMSNKELVDYILATMRGELRQTVEPVQKGVQFAEMQRQVNETSAKYPDFWDFRNDMVNLARNHPTLTAEDAYLIAKGKASKAPKKPAKPSEPPVGGNQMKRKPAEGFESKFLEAWRQAGMTEKE